MIRVILAIHWRRVWLQTCTLSNLHSQHLHSQQLALSATCTLSNLHSQQLALSATCASTSDVTCSLFDFDFVLFIDSFFCLNLSTFYINSQVVKTRKKKLNYNATCNRCFHSPLPATLLALDTNCVRCQRRQDTVVVK